MERTACQTMAERFLWALEQKGISQRELARRLDTNPVFLSKLGTGKSKKTRMVVDIALALDVTPEWLEYGIENNRVQIELTAEERQAASQTFMAKVAGKISAASLSTDEIHKKTGLSASVINRMMTGQHELSLVEALQLCDFFKTSLYEMIKKDACIRHIPLIGGQDIIHHVIAPGFVMEVDFIADSQHLIGIRNDGSFTGQYLNQGNVVIVDPDVKSFNMKNGDTCLFVVDNNIDIGLKDPTGVRSLNFFSNVYDLSRIEMIGKVAFLELNPATSDTSKMLKGEIDQLIQTIQKIIPAGTLTPQYTSPQTT
ncbi:helix-turn-helix transcriptional regulator [Vibrio quintilis]|uniref:Helix-turn-helix domain protein n=1 Tax=Vibrio quintilis TaxID=1117707 RepID=A0A1M7YW19_9VIBR|nr:helix-turn-helix transcriptional regulator [Vibrio quintilis]SHO56801.1 Helix-turn-helix domain protein [Vibrio quintilis]